MGDLPHVAACQDGDGCRAHLWTKKLRATEAAGPRKRETGPSPEHGCKYVERDNCD